VTADAVVVVVVDGRASMESIGRELDGRLTRAIGSFARATEVSIEKGRRRYARGRTTVGELEEAGA